MAPRGTRLQQQSFHRAEVTLNPVLVLEVGKGEENKSLLLKVLANKCQCWSEEELPSLILVFVEGGMGQVAVQKELPPSSVLQLAAFIKLTP